MSVNKTERLIRVSQKKCSKTCFPVTLSEFVDRYYLSSKIVLSEFDDSRNYTFFANLENVKINQF